MNMIKKMILMSLFLLVVLVGCETTGKAIGGVDDQTDDYTRVTWEEEYTGDAACAQIGKLCHKVYRYGEDYPDRTVTCSFRIGATSLSPTALCQNPSIGTGVTWGGEKSAHAACEEIDLDCVTAYNIFGLEQGCNFIPYGVSGDNPRATALCNVSETPNNDPNADPCQDESWTKSITNCCELQLMNDSLSSDYVLVQDIDCSETRTWNGGTGFKPISGFSGGVLDGKGFVVENIYINTTGNTGLFANLGGTAVVRNLGLRNVLIQGDHYVGGFGGHISDTAILENSYVTGKLLKTDGYFKYGSYTGGLFGYAQCKHVNGGSSPACQIKNSYAALEFDFPYRHKHYVGGLIAAAGWRAETVSNSYWDSELCGISYTNYRHDSRYTVGSQTTSEMKQQSTYVGWDFDNVWAIDPNVNEGYPYLKNNNPERDGGPGSNIKSIRTCQDLQDINNDLGADYVLANDIDCSDFEFEMIGWVNGVSIGDFTGTFDGQGFNILGLHPSNDTTLGYWRHFSLFSSISGDDSSPVVIKDFGITNLDISEGIYLNFYILTGSIDGNVTIKNCNVEGKISNISSSYLVMDLRSSSIIDNCSVNLNSSGGVSFSGFAQINQGIIRNSYFKGTINASRSASGFAMFNTGLIENCYAEGTISLEEVGPYVNNINRAVAGLVSVNRGTIKDSHSDIKLYGGIGTHMASGYIAAKNSFGEIIDSSYYDYSGDNVSDCYQYCLDTDILNDKTCEGGWLSGNEGCTSMSQQNEQKYFTFQIDTSKGGYLSDYSFMLDDATMSIDWGDGNFELFSGTGTPSHEYAVEGIFNISINGSASRISYFEGQNRKALLDILTNISPAVSGINNSEHMFAFIDNLGKTPLTEPRFFDDVSGNVTNMYKMFYGSDFNQDISDWDTSSVINMREMFSNSLFNQPLNDWDVSNVENMIYMFYGPERTNPFNQDISNWDVSSVTSMYGMFRESLFNQDISDWNVSNVKNMGSIFQGEYFKTPFNQDISRWDVSSVINMRDIFFNSQFNQDLSAWNLSDNINIGFDHSLMNVTNYDNTLLGWNNKLTPANRVTVTAFGLKYCLGKDARQNLIDNHGWTFRSDSYDCTGVDIPTEQKYFTFQINTSRITGTEFEFFADDASLTINWGDGNITGYIGTGEIIHIYDSEGVYDISLNGTASRISFGDDCIDAGGYRSGTQNALVDILTNISSGVSGINSSKLMLRCTNYLRDPLSEPKFFDDVSGNVEDMSYMFFDSTFNQDISGWDTSNTKMMNSMFKDSLFNQDISNWDVSSVTSMSWMFSHSSFNQDISGWDISSITSMTQMLRSSEMDIDNYDNLLIGWNNLPNLPSGIVFDAAGLKYCLGKDARQNMIDNHGWTFRYDDYDCGDTDQMMLAEETKAVVTEKSVKLSLEGTPPFNIVITGDSNLEDDKYVSAITDKNELEVDLDFAINPSGEFYYLSEDINGNVQTGSFELYQQELILRRRLE